MFKTFLLALEIISLFGLIDYFIYNLVYKNRILLIIYRILQSVLWATTAILLWDKVSWVCSVQFLLLYFTWFGDWVYYFLCEITNGFGLDWLPGRGSIKEVFDNLVTWAWWTLYGVFTRLIPWKLNEPISGKILAIQGVLGIFFSIILEYLL